MDLNVIRGEKFSSIRYKIFKDGRAIKIKIMAGRIVQIVSIVWASIKVRNVILFNISEVILNKINEVINVRINIKWSWK
jgi:hypothetical protein